MKRGKGGDCNIQKVVEGAKAVATHCRNTSTISPIPSDIFSIPPKKMFLHYVKYTQSKFLTGNTL